MIIRNHKEQSIIETPHQIEVKQLYDKLSAQVMHILLNPGEGLKPHKTPVDVFFYVLEGNPTIHIAEETVICCKDDLIESPADITHWITNQTEIISRVLVVKAPKPLTSSKLL